VTVVYVHLDLVVQLATRPMIVQENWLEMRHWMHVVFAMEMALLVWDVMENLSVHIMILAVSVEEMEQHVATIVTIWTAGLVSMMELSIVTGVQMFNNVFLE